MPMIKNAAVTASDNQVVVRLHEAIVPPNLAGAVASCLTCRSTEFVAGGSNGVQRRRATQTFYQRDDAGYVKLRAGLVPRVVDACEQRGITTSIIDRSRWPVLEEIAVNLPSMATDENRNLLNAVAGSPRGQIVVHTRDSFKLVSLLCQAFATVRVLIVTVNREQRDNLLARLRCEQNRPMSSHDNITWGASDRLTLVTSQVFAGIGRLNNDFDVVLFLSPTAVTGHQAFETASELNNELLFCLVPPSYRPDTLTQFRLEAVCGPVIHEDVESAPVVQVVMLDTPSLPAPAKLSELERKRRTIWENDERNEFIAEIAHTLDGDETFSRRCEFLRQYADQLDSNPAIAVHDTPNINSHYRHLSRKQGNKPGKPN